MVSTTMSRHFGAGANYLNTASVGIPPRQGVTALRQAIDDWEAGQCDPPAYDESVHRSRAAFGKLVGVPTSWVALTGAASITAGLVATNLEAGSRVLCAEEDFTSVLFPFLVDERLTVEFVPLAELLDRVDATVDLVAVSAVQSVDGRVLDMARLAEAAQQFQVKTFLDLTQAAGWLPLDVSQFDVTVAGAYKWLCCPRGIGFTTVHPDADWMRSRLAGWYSGDGPWQSVYGPPLRLAPDAQQFNISPAWMDVEASAPTLELFDEIGVETIYAHNVALANRFRAGMGLSTADSAIVSVESERAPLLTQNGVACAVRDGKLRVAFHLYNSVDDVDRAIEIMTA